MLRQGTGTNRSKPLLSYQSSNNAEASNKTIIVIRGQGRGPEWPDHPHSNIFVGVSGEFRI